MFEDSFYAEGAMYGWRQFVQFFGFSKRELAGVRVLLLGISLLILIPPVAKRWWIREMQIDPQIQAEIDRFLATRGERDPGRAADDRRIRSGEDEGWERESSQGRARADMRTKNPEIFRFDPNQLDLAGWARLGFSERQAQAILNYREKGGRFRKKEDLQKLYVISDADYRRLADYVMIPEVADLARSPTRSPTFDPTFDPELNPAQDPSAFDLAFDPSFDPGFDPSSLSIEINAADSLIFQLLPGIGPAFAARMVRFRERLGGFYDIRQLLQVYGMDSARYAGFADRLQVDPSLIQRIRINEADYDTFRRHPLIGRELGGLIMRYRTHHGRFQSIDDLRAMKVFDEEFLRIIVHYFEF